MPIFTPNATTHHGLVISEREHNGSDDSDFYATIWNVDEGRPEEILWGTTRGAMGPSYGFNCRVDAEPWVLAAYERWLQKRHASCWVRVALIESDVTWMRFKGDVVEVTRGRKVPKGFRGEVLSVSEVYNPFSRSKYPDTMLFVSNGRQSWQVKADYTDLVQRSPARQQLIFDAE